MHKHRTSPVDQRPHNGALPRLARKSVLFNQIKYLSMAEQVVFETTIWVSKVDSENPGNQPFFGYERYIKTL